MSTPIVTVLMPVYNGEKYLKDAIDSILSQSFADFEFLIINDGSTDASAAIIKSYTDSRIRLIENSSNIGLIASLNKGIELAKGKYIARMDCDDISLPQRLEKEFKILESEPYVDIVATQMLLINSEGYKTGMWSGDTPIKSNEEICRQMPKDCCIAHPSVMVKSSLLREYLYNPKQKGAEDWDLWLRAASDGKVFLKINELLLKYRVHPTSATIIRNQVGIYINRLKVQRKYCFTKIKKLHFTGFDFRVLGHVFSNFFNHLLSILHPSLPIALSHVFKTNIFRVICQSYKIAALKIPDSTRFFLFVPSHNTSSNELKYQQFTGLLDKGKTLIFITDKTNIGSPEQNIVDISSISSYPYIQKWVKKKVRKYIHAIANPIIVGYNSQFYYNIIDLSGNNVKCIDIFDNNMDLNESPSGLIYNYGIWSMPYAERFDKRIAIGEETFNEIHDYYNAFKINPDLFNRMEYISNFIDIRKKLEEL